MARGHLLEHVDDAALGRPVGPSPGGDRRSPAHLVGDRLEHRLHLGRQARQHVDVLDHEARRSAVRDLEWAAALREQRPAGRVLGVRGETRAKSRGDVADLHLADAERGGDRLAGDVVRRAAEPAGDDHDVHGRRLLADERGDPVDLVRHHRDQRDLDAERGQPPCQPRAVRVLDVPRQELVPDGDDRGPGHRERVYERARRAPGAARARLPARTRPRAADPGRGRGLPARPRAADAQPLALAAEPLRRVPRGAVQGPARAASASGRARSGPGASSSRCGRASSPRRSTWARRST